MIKYETVLAYVTLALGSVHEIAEAHKTAVSDGSLGTSLGTRGMPQTIHDVTQEIQSIERAIETVKLQLEHESNDAVKDQLHRTLILLIKRLSLLQKKLCGLQGKEFPVSYAPSTPLLEYLHWESESKGLASSKDDEQLMINTSHELNRRIAILRESILKTQATLPSLSKKHDIDRANAQVKRLRMELEHIQMHHPHE